MQNGAPVERARLQDLLWSTRPGPQGRDSLKKCLAEIRQIFDQDGGQQPLETDGGPVRLSLKRITVDVLQGPPPCEGFTAPVFLEGVDLPDEPFNEWLSEVRTRLEEAYGTKGIPAVRPLQTELSHSEKSPAAHLFGLAVMPVQAEGIGAHLGDLVLDACLRHAANTGLFNCFDFRSGVERPPKQTRCADLILKANAVALGDGVCLGLTVTQIGKGRAIFSHTFNLVPKELSRAAIDARASQIIDQLCEKLRHFDGFGNERHLAARNLIGAIDHIFRLSNADLLEAERLLREALAIQESSSAFGWSAFLSAFKAEKQGRRTALGLIEDTRRLSNRALEMDRHNGLTAALVGHAFNFVLRDADTAGSILSPFEQQSAGNPMLADTLAMMHFYAGRYADAHRYAVQAASAGRFNPFRYSFTTSVGMTNLMLGKHQAAIRNCRDALAQHPVIGGYRYEPTLRTLATACALGDRLDEGRAALGQLEAQGEGFTLERLKSSDDAPYPNPEVFALVRNGLERLHG
ncbi:MAG: hypothetical protein AAGG69_16030 [Pseudomonadota bacterium]